MCLHGTDAAQTHKCNKTGELWKIKSAIDRCSKNIIYKLNCKRCPQFIYVGETSRRAKDRFYQHRSNILTNNQETPAGCHFNTAGHKVTDMIMIPFERVRPANNPNTRKCREKYWINRYQAVTYGANKQKSSQLQHQRNLHNHQMRIAKKNFFFLAQPFVSKHNTKNYCEW